MLVSGRCAYGGGLLRRGCRAEAVADCVYCGRVFCKDHGVRGPDFTDVCDGKKCRAKLRDLEEHQGWRREAASANGTSVCADDGCSSRMRYECSRCRLRFCEDHVRTREVTDRTKDPPARVQATVCSHCNARRRLWD